jgi:hypothetical protein
VLAVRRRVVVGMLNDYTATIEKNLLNGDWVIRVRYVASFNAAANRNRYASFVLVPSHQGSMFSSVCESIEQAIERHRAGGVRAAR